MNWTLEVVLVPVSDVDRSMAFYADQLGFHVDHDTEAGDDMRFVQLTPPGSGCSIVIGKRHPAVGARELPRDCSWSWPTSSAGACPAGRARSRRQ